MVYPVGPTGRIQSFLPFRRDRCQGSLPRKLLRNCSQLRLIMRNRQKRQLNFRGSSDLMSRAQDSNLATAEIHAFSQLSNKRPHNAESVRKNNQRFKGERSVALNRHSCQKQRGIWLALTKETLLFFIRLSTSSTRGLETLTCA